VNLSRRGRSGAESITQRTLRSAEERRSWAFGNERPLGVLCASVVKFLFSPLLLPPSLFAKKSREKSLFLLFRDQAEAEDAPIEFHLVLSELQKFSFTGNERMSVE
jgi:hypothetical protein